MTTKTRKAERFCSGTIVPSSANAEILQLLQDYRNVDDQYQQIKSQNRQVLGDVERVEAERLVIKRHIIEAMEASQTYSLQLEDTNITLSHDDQELSIYNKESIPDRFTVVRERKVVNRKGLKRLLQKGLQIPGASLTFKKEIEIAANGSACSLS